MPRDAGKEVVYSLELQPAVKEVEPGGTIHVHGRAQHALREGFVDAEVGGAHREVGEGDLDVHGRRDHVADHDEGEARPSGRNGFVDREVAEPVPEKELAGDLEVAVPPRRPLSRSLAQEDVLPAQDVEVEAAEGEERVVQPVLVLENEFRESVVRHDAVVVCASQAGEEAVRDGEEGHVLDVGVVLGAVRDDVVDIVVAFPPADGEAADEVGDEYTNAGIDVEVMCYAHVACIMDCEDELVPKEAEEDGGECEPLLLQEVVC